MESILSGTVNGLSSLQVTFSMFFSDVRGTRWAQRTNGGIEQTALWRRMGA